MSRFRDDPRAPGLGLLEAFAIFSRQFTARMLFGLAAVVIAARIWLGEFTIWDPMLAAMMVIFHPLTEWVIHVVLLHWKPRRILGIWVDFRASKDHRSHHEAPHDPKYWFMPISTSLLGFASAWVLGYLLLPAWPIRFTFVGVALCIGFVYEWTHYLCHSSYRPRSAWYRRLWKYHRLHHFKNEHYWMGVTMQRRRPHARHHARRPQARPDVADVPQAPGLGDTP